MLYRDAWDIKPPFIYANYALAEFLFGYGQHSIRILDLANTAITAFLVGRIASKVSRTASLLATGAYPFLYFLTFNFWDTAQAESFAQPFAAAAILNVVNRRSPFAIGLCVGAASMYKPTYGLLFIPVLFYARPQWRTWLQLGLGSSVPVAATVAYFVAHSASGLLYEQVQLMRAYAAPLPADGVKFSLNMVFIETGVIQAGALIGAITLATWRERIVQLAWLWWLIALLMIVIQGRYFAYHAISMAAPVALLIGIALGHAQQSMVMRCFGSIAFVCVLTAALTSHAPYFARTQRFTGLFGFDSAENAAAARLISALPGSTMWIDGFESNLYYQARRFPPTRHLSTAPIFGERQIPSELRDRLAKELQSALIASPPDVWVELLPLSGGSILRHGNRYQFVASVGRYHIYRHVPSNPSRSGPA
jgi:hypothetical protein